MTEVESSKIITHESQYPKSDDIEVKSFFIRWGGGVGWGGGRHVETYAKI